MNEKAMSAIQPRITPEKAAEIERALHEACKPFVDEMVKLYSMAPVAARFYPDGRIEVIDPYEAMPPELQAGFDKLHDFKRQAERSVLRAHGIDPGNADSTAT